MSKIGRKRQLSISKPFFKRLFYRYRLTVTNEDEQKTVVNFKVSHFTHILSILATLGIGAAIGIYSFTYSPSQQEDQRQSTMLRQTIIDQALRLDSLEQTVLLQEKYVNSVQEIIAGSVHVDSVYSVDSLTKVRSQQLMEASEREIEFAAQYEMDEKYNITASSAMPVSDLSDIGMFRPTAGLVIKHFNPNAAHLGVDIVASPNQSVVATMDGTVIFAVYTADMGYSVCIAHPGQLISVYKHCESVLKQSGDKVSLGEAVALVGRGNADDKSSHLHFELWYQGQPLDPEKYILFQ
ncbi:MAG: M23 family metallopeptidase [Bacteroidaceae bacterium]|nr:M23 family metallopeptidase [Bacteroidaceae bacterium]